VPLGEAGGHLGAGDVLPDGAVGAAGGVPHLILRGVAGHAAGGGGGKIRKCGDGGPSGSFGFLSVGDKGDLERKYQPTTA